MKFYVPPQDDLTLTYDLTNLLPSKHPLNYDVF